MVHPPSTGAGMFFSPLPKGALRSNLAIGTPVNMSRRNIAYSVQRIQIIQTLVLIPTRLLAGEGGGGFKMPSQPTPGCISTGNRTCAPSSLREPVMGDDDSTCFESLTSQSQKVCRSGGGRQRVGTQDTRKTGKKETKKYLGCLLSRKNMCTLCGVERQGHTERLESMKTRRTARAIISDGYSLGCGLSAG